MRRRLLCWLFTHDLAGTFGVVYCRRCGRSWGRADLISSSAQRKART